MTGFALSVAIALVGILALFYTKSQNISADLVPLRKDQAAAKYALSLMGAVGILTVGSQIMVLGPILFYVSRQNKVTAQADFSCLARTTYSLVKQSFLPLIKFWPVIFIASVFSHQVLSEYPRQELVSALKEGELKEKSSIILSALVLAPITEEFFFRKCLYAALKSDLGIFFAGLVSSFLFSAIHQSVSAFLMLFLIGLFLCYCYEKSGNLWVPIIAHGLFNGIMISSILLS